MHGYLIESRHAARLGPPPALPSDRRRRARRLLGLGAATLAAVSAAWYAGDAAAARAEIYAGCDRATAARHG
jgi:hypothetical protein